MRACVCVGAGMKVPASSLQSVAILIVCVGRDFALVLV